MSYRLADPPKIDNTECKLSDDRSRVTFSPAAGGETVTLDAESLDRMLVILGMWRAKMLPAVPDTPPKGALIGIRSRIEVTRADLTGEPVLQIRDAGLGWLNYLLSHDQARELGEKLIAKADAPPPATAGSA